MQERLRHILHRILSNKTIGAELLKIRPKNNEEPLRKHRKNKKR